MAFPKIGNHSHLIVLGVLRELGEKRQNKTQF